MQIAVNGKQLKVGDSLRGHIENSISQISEKYFGNPIEAAVTMSRDGTRIRADIAVHVGGGIQVHGQGDATDAYLAFDAAADHIGKRLRRFKRRLRDHRRVTEAGDSNGGGELALQQVFAAVADRIDETPDRDDEAAEWQPVVVAEMKTKIDSLTVEEAVMHLEFGTAPALMFRNSAHGGLNMVYRREDGNIGWIDPAGAPTA